MGGLVHQRFSANLRLALRKFSSISEVCRAIGVNRQQFNKYLAGTHLPHAKTRKKICEYMGVTEEEMFWPPDAQTATRLSNSLQTEQVTHSVSPALQSVFKYLANNLNCPMDLHGSEIKDGFYFCYFSMQNNRSMLVRSALRISSKAGIKTFVRHTIFRSGTLPTRVIASGKNSGIVTSTQTEVGFLGINRSLPHHMSLLTFSRQHAPSSHIMFGLGLSRGIAKPYGSRVCLEFISEKMSVSKKVLPLVGVTHISDAAIHPSIAMYFKSSGNNDFGQLEMPNLEDLLAASNKGSAASNFGARKNSSA
jgi:transcriptional regulator with XRE-family HTH domain